MLLVSCKCKPACLLATAASICNAPIQMPIRTPRTTRKRLIISLAFWDLTSPKTQTSPRAGKGYLLDQHAVVRRAVMGSEQPRLFCKKIRAPGITSRLYLFINPPSRSSTRPPARLPCPPGRTPPTQESTLHLGHSHPLCCSISISRIHTGIAPCPMLLSVFLPSPSATRTT